MKSLSDHAQKVSDCIKLIEKDLKKHNFKAYDKHFNKKIVNISILKNCSKYGLKSSNIRMIFEGRFEVEKPKKVKFNNF